MNIVLKKCTSENNKIHKSFEDTTISIDFEFKNPSSVFDPVIVVHSESGLYGFNYGVIQELRRKYFITDIKLLRSTVYEISLHVDVLDTYADEILRQQAIIKRQENKYNLYLDDEKFVTYKNDTIQTKEFPKGFNKTLNYVLVVNGS